MVHNGHPSPADRKEFLVDGCPRCREYVDDLGRHFDPERFRAFWEYVVRVEWDNDDHYRSEYDRELGGRLYLVMLSLQQAFLVHPREISWRVAFDVRPILDRLRASEEAWMIVYDDADREPEVFVGVGAEEAARGRSRHAGIAWTHSLFVEVDRR